jgi:hypothetical protein
MRNGKLVAEGPVPWSSTETRRCRARALQRALVRPARAERTAGGNSHAVIDWQVELGKNRAPQRKRARKDRKPDLLVVDAAWFERAGMPAVRPCWNRWRRAPLLVLGANANDAGVWSRSMACTCRRSRPTRLIGGPLPLPAAPSTRRAHAGAWSGSDSASGRAMGQGPHRLAGRRRLAPPRDRRAARAGAVVAGRARYAGRRTAGRGDLAGTAPRCPCPASGWKSAHSACAAR